jgi:hypothetical protein
MPGENPSDQPVADAGAGGRAEPPAVSAPPAYTPPPGNYPAGAYPSSYGGQYVAVSESNGIATAAGILGIISIFIFGLILGVLAIVLGVIGNRNAARLGGKGRGMAITGIVCGIIGLIGWIIIIGVIVGIRTSTPAT